MRVRYEFSSRRTRRIDPHNRHKKAVFDVVSDIIRISDVILEILDARFIDDTRNTEIENLVKEKGKKLVYVLNKSDLVKNDELIKEAEEKKLFPYLIVSCKDRMGKEKVIERVKIEAKRALVGKKFAIAHVGIIGYPNTGKSSIINYLGGRKVARTSKFAGFTKGMQKIRLSSSVLLLDTPGIIPMVENSNISNEDLKKHAKINVGTYDRVKEPEFVVSELMKDNPGLFEKFYGIDANGDSEILIESVGKIKNLLLRGGKIDIERASRQIIKDWQDGKIK